MPAFMKRAFIIGHINMIPDYTTTLMKQINKELDEDQINQLKY